MRDRYLLNIWDISGARYCAVGGVRVRRSDVSDRFNLTTRGEKLRARMSDCIYFPHHPLY